MANWPGTVVRPEEAYGNRRILREDPSIAPAQQPAQEPQGSVQAQFPGEVQPEGFRVASGNLEGDLGFYNDSAMDANSRPAQSNEYQAAMWAGLQDGSIKTPEDANQLAARFGLQIPDQEALAKAFAPGATITGVNPAEYGTRPVAELRKDAVLSEGADAFARGVPGAFGLDDEIDALVTTATRGGNLRENLSNSRAIRDYDEENNFWPRLGGEIVGGSAVGGGVPSRLKEVAQVAARQAIRMGATREAALAAARRAVAIRAAQEGAGFGAVSGFWEADGGALDRTLGAAGGGAAGAVTGGVLGNLGNRFAQRGMNRVEQAAPPAEELMGALDNLEMTPFAPDVGGATTRRIAAAAVQTPFGAAPIVKAAQRVTDEGQAVRDRVASRIGQVLNPEAGGETGIAGAKEFIARTSTQGNGLYKAAEAAAGDARIVPTKALANLDAHIAELSETPLGAGGLAHLQALRGELAKGDFTVRGIRNMRTALRDEFESAGLRGSDIERRARQVVDAANEDVIDGLRAAGRGEAADRYAKADEFWRKRLETIDNVLEPIIGKGASKSGEEVVGSLQRSMKGNNRRFVEFLDALPEAERNDVRATLISRLGRSTKGNQNDEGSAFSLQTFLSNWDEIGESAKRALFGAESRAAMNDLAKVASASRQAQSYANKSNTGGAVGGLLTGVAAIPSMLAIVPAQYLTGRLIASPRFARWLARAPRTNLSPPAYIDRLSRIARAEPAIAGDILSLQRHLSNAFSQSPARLAADEGRDESGRVIGQNNEGAEQRREPEPTP
jgi:hypothetical protein